MSEIIDKKDTATVDKKDTADKKEVKKKKTVSPLRLGLSIAWIVVVLAAIILFMIFVKIPVFTKIIFGILFAAAGASVLISFKPD